MRGRCPPELDPGDPNVTVGARAGVGLAGGLGRGRCWGTAVNREIGSLQHLPLHLCLPHGNSQIQRQSCLPSRSGMLFLCSTFASSHLPTPSTLHFILARPPPPAPLSSPQVEVNLLKEPEDYVAPAKPKVVAFAGAGRKLGGEREGRGMA